MLWNLVSPEVRPPWWHVSKRFFAMFGQLWTLDNSGELPRNTTSKTWSSLPQQDDATRQLFACFPWYSLTLLDFLFPNQIVSGKIISRTPPIETVPGLIKTAIMETFVFEMALPNRIWPFPYHLVKNLGLMHSLQRKNERQAQRNETSLHVF